MLNDFISLFFPNNCSCCNQVLKKGENYVCVICQTELPRTNYINQKDNPVSKLFWGRVELIYGFSTFHFGKHGRLQDLIHDLKYKNATGIGLFLGQQVGQEIKDSLPPNTFSYVIPVPLHPKKKLQRGYNQSTFLAEGISEVCGVPMNEKIIIRQVETTSQTRKSKFERWENVEDIFKIIDARHENKHFLLVDDVVTTGSTLESCALELLKIPGSKVSIAVAASGL